MNTSERNKQMSSPAHLYDSFQTTWQVSVRKEFGKVKAAPMRPVIWQQRIFASLIKKFSPHSAFTSRLVWSAVSHKTNQQILQGVSVAVCSRLRVPACWRHVPVRFESARKVQQSGQLEASFPGKPLDRWLLPHRGLLLCRERVPSLQLTY